MIKKVLSRIGIFFLFVISLLPFWVLFGIADILFLVVYYLVGYRKKVVRENLANSFPDKSFLERKLIEVKYYRYLCDLMLETIKLLTHFPKASAPQV